MIRSIRLRNFRRYVDATFDLTEGLNFIEGVNNAGKTSVLYAIEYALFGKVGSNLQAIGLMHPGTRQVGVELVFDGKDGRTNRLNVCTKSLPGAAPRWWATSRSRYPAPMKRGRSISSPQTSTIAKPPSQTLLLGPSD
ncbi:MAG: AAA family ATPase [Myxococcota bacterium]